MTKFEEEFEHELDYFIERELSLDEKLSFGARDVLVKFFSGWHSPEHIEKEIQMKLLKLQQQALPVVSECVGEWIECVKGKNKNALALLDDDNMPDDVNEWLFFQRNDDNINLILRAWLDGFKVEKPQLFYIELPKVFGLSDSTFVSKVESGIISEFTKGKDYALKFTEQEIKSIDERYWQFAVPVEDEK